MNRPDSHQDAAVATTGAPLFALRDLEYRFPGGFRLALERLTIERGERLAIIGHNGSGKTTLLRLLARLEEPASAALFVRPDSARIGFLKQDPYLFDDDVAGNLSYPLRVRRVPAGEIGARVSAMLDKIGLTALASRSARRLSGGEQKRLALGRVLMSEPEALLLDEPDAFLDRHSQEVIERILAGTKAAWVVTTHDLRFAHRVARRIVPLREGRLAYSLPVNVLQGDLRGETVVTPTGLEIHLGGAQVADSGGVTSSGEGTRPIRFSLDPNSLVLSREAFASSMRNSFAGRVSAVHDERDSIWVEIDVRSERLTAIISRESYERLGLNVNQDIRVSFKAHAVEVL